MRRRPAAVRPPGLARPPLKSVFPGVSASRLISRILGAIAAILVCIVSMNSGIKSSYFVITAAPVVHR